MDKSYIVSQLELHPSAEPADIVKMCYQSCFGPFHLMSAGEKMKAYFVDEFNSIEPSDGPLYEEISEKYVRVNMAVWKYMNYPAESLFEIFMKTCEESSEIYGKMQEEEKTEYFTVTAYKYIDELCLSGHKNKADEFKKILPLYLENGVRPVSHSEKYRLAENPHYRVISSGLLKIRKEFFT